MPALAGCGGAGTASPGGRPTVVVTTSILGDVTGELIADAAEVVVVWPLVPTLMTSKHLRNRSTTRDVLTR